MKTDKCKCLSKKKIRQIIREELKNIQLLVEATEIEPITNILPDIDDVSLEYKPIAQYITGEGTEPFAPFRLTKSSLDISIRAFEAYLMEMDDAIKTINDRYSYKTSKSTQTLRKSLITSYEDEKRDAQNLLLSLRDFRANNFKKTL